MSVRSLQSPEQIQPQDMGTIGRLLAMWSVQTARDTAWTNAELLWELQDLPSVRDDFLLVLDRLTGLAGRGLLTIVEGA